MNCKLKDVSINSIDHWSQLIFSVQDQDTYNVHWTIEWTHKFVAKVIWFIASSWNNQ